MRLLNIKLNESVTRPVGLQNRAWNFHFTRLLDKLALVMSTSNYHTDNSSSSAGVTSPSLEALISLAVLLSWQWRCNAWRFPYLSFPPRDLGMIWSISIKSSSLKYNSQWAHFPFCSFRSFATLVGTSGCSPLLELQYFRFPSNGDAVPLTFMCLTIFLLEYLEGACHRWTWESILGVLH